MNSDQRNGSDLSSLARVYLLVDNAMIRAGLAQLLQRGQFSVIGQGTDPEIVLAEVSSSNCDIVLVDLRHPDSDGFHWGIRLRAQLGGVRVLVLRENPAPDQVRLALSEGVDCVLSAHGEISELFIALDSLHRGHTYLSPGLAASVTSHAGELPREFMDTSVQLTELEIRIARELALGHTADEIAESFGISSSEAGERVRMVAGKLSCSSTADFARLAIREGYLPE